jgi:plasmid stabilization system protein ParE
MYAVVLSAAAQTDLDDIVRYIAVDNPTAAEKLGLDLIDVAMSLETLPYRGSRVQKHRTTLFKYSVSHTVRGLNRSRSNPIL